MSSSNAAAPETPCHPSPSGGDEIQYLSEYEEVEEEIEIEEEVEVEVEVEEEEEVVFSAKEEESEIGVALTPARKEENSDDTDIDMEIEQEEEHLNPDPLTMTVSVEKLQLDIATNQEFSGGLGQKEESCTNDACSQKDSGVGSAAPTPLQTAVEAAEVKNVMTSRRSGPLVSPKDSSYGGEFNVVNKRPKIVCEFHAKGWCIRGKSCRFLHLKEGLDSAACSSARMPPPQTRDNPINSQIEKSAVHKHDLLNGALEQAGKTPIGPNSCMDDFSRYTTPSIKFHPSVMNRTLHGNFSGTSWETYDKSRFFPSGTEETVNKRNELLLDAYSSNLSFYSRPPLPFGSSSWMANAHTVGAWNTLQSNQENPASVSSFFRKSPSPLSGSNSGCLSVNNNLPSKHPTEDINKFFPDGWEPSVPFRPSHVISQNLLLKESPDEPILDSVQQTGAKHEPFEFFNSDPAVSIDDAHFESNKFQIKKLLDTNHVEDTGKASRLSSSCGNGLKLDEERHHKEMQMDGCDKRYENGVDIKRDEIVQNESKALKSFHAVLVEYVKELVKPTWKEGLMSKDAHKIIVKKSVDKVMSTLQPDQIPITAESIQSYLSISQVKLSKLVEAYIERYGKC